MALTREQLEQAIQNLNTKVNDPALSSAEQAQARADLTKLSVAWKQLGAQPATQPLTEAASPERSNYLADRMKLGFTDFLSRALPDTVRPYVFDYEEPSTQGVDLATQGATLAQESQRRRAEAVQQKAQEWFGAGAPRAASDNLERYAGIALESIASDPVMSVLGGKGVTGVAGSLLSSGVSGLAGSVGYDVVAETANSLGASPELQDTLGQLGAAVTGGVVGLSATMASSAINTAQQGRRVLSENRDIQRSLDTASDYIVSSGMRQVVDDIVTADPNIDANIEAIRNISRLVPKFKVGPGIALYDNAVIRKNMETLLKESPQFRASVEASLKDLGNAIKVRQEALFGTASNADVVRTVTSSIGNYGVKLNAAQRRIDNIDNTIGTLVNKVRTAKEPVDIGTAATKLMEAKEAALRTKNSAQYEYLLNKYTEAGLEFPAESVQKLHEFVGGVTMERLFTPFPTLVGKMKQYLTPKVSEAPPQAPSMMSLLAGRPAAATPTQTYQPLTLRQLDSLKQEVNKAIRQARTPNSNLGNALPSLNILKDTLRAEILALPEFGKAYSDVDAAFYRELGIPFDSAGLSQLDSLKFNETVGNYLSKPERATDFLAFVGDAGYPIVKDSILLRMRPRIFSQDGSFKPDAYAKFLAENGAVINTVPGLRAELNDIGSTIAQMDATKARLDAQAKEADMAQADNFLKAVNEKGLNAAINDLLIRPEKLVNYTNTLNKLDPDSGERVRNGIRTALLNKAFDSPEGAAAFIAKNPEVFNGFFGSAYTANVKALADAYDIMRRIDPSRMTFAFSYKEADALQRATGSSMPQVGSILRDRISSTAQKLSILLSRWFTKRTSARRDTEIMSLLASPDALNRISSTASAYRANQIDAKEFLQRITAAIPLTIVRTQSLAQTGAEVEKRTPEVK